MKASRLVFLMTWLFSMILGGSTVHGASPTNRVLQQPEGIDLDVTYINRSPMHHAYCVEYPGNIPRLRAGTENEQRWPESGEVVTFTAHVINKGTQDSPPFDYTWSVDNSSYYDPATDIDWGLVHEWSHQVGLIDLYGSGIYADNVFVQAQNGWQTNFGFDWPRPDLTFGGDIYPHTTDEHVYSSHAAGGALSHLGYRNGYYGVYQYDIPQQNWLRLLDNQGNPAEGAQVALFQRQGPTDWTDHIGLDNTPEITGTTGVDGRFLLPNLPSGGGTTTQTGHVLQDNPFGLVDFVGTQNRFLVRLSQGEHEEFHWMDVTEFNLAYWLGDNVHLC